MILLYSGAIAPDSTQNNPSQSLGGFCSSSPLQNGVIGNLFPIIDQEGVFDVRMIVLKNTTPVSITDLKIYTLTPNDSTQRLKLAVVEPAFDSKCQRYYFEQIINPHSLPFQAILDYQEGVDNAVEIGELESGKMIGIWIQRLQSETTTTTTLNPFLSNTQFGNGCTDQSIIDLENQKENPIQTFNVQLKIDY